MKDINWSMNVEELSSLFWLYQTTGFGLAKKPPNGRLVSWSTYSSLAIRCLLFNGWLALALVIMQTWWQQTRQRYFSVYCQKKLISAQFVSWLYQFKISKIILNTCRNLKKKKKPSLCDWQFLYYDYYSFVFFCNQEEGSAWTRVVWLSALNRTFKSVNPYSDMKRRVILLGLTDPWHWVHCTSHGCYTWSK